VGAVNVAAWLARVDAYEALWSPVILPPAESLVRHLDLCGSGLVVDVGAGTGALLGAIGSAAAAARTVALDASARMLQVARTRRGASAVLADAVALPLADGCASAVILAYLLFHLPDPVWALAEAARVLGPAGRAGTVTWGWERAPRASGMWSQILADAGVPPGPLRHADTGLDTPDAVAATLRSAGLQPECIWSQPLRRQWDRSSYFRLASGGGASRARLSLVDSATRAKVLVLLRRRLEQLSPGDLLWEGEVICAHCAVWRGDPLVTANSWPSTTDSRWRPYVDPRCYSRQGCTAWRLRAKGGMSGWNIDWWQRRRWPRRRWVRRHPVHPGGRRSRARRGRAARGGRL